MMLKQSGKAFPAAAASMAPRRTAWRTSMVAGLVMLAVATAGAFGPARATPVAVAAAPAATGPTPLDKYLDNLKTLRTTFLQTLADGQGREIDRATGTLIVVRPGKFSWDIHPQAASTAGASGGAGAGANTGAAVNGAGDGAASEPGNRNAGQLMVSDGRNLWFFDRDLEQVTVKPVDAALSATPAMLLSGTVDVRKNFTLTPAGQRDGLDWVLVEPHGTDADFRDALFGFANGDLKRMILEDKLGQTATVLFDHIERNGPVTPQETSFTPPKGTDVIGTPRK
jgi:outer membrane lipoprotein carrier protein